jgi:hypothetical protein
VTPFASKAQIHEGPWQEATPDTANVRRFSWRFWTLDWPDAGPGEYTITARATDREGNIQPAKDDPLIATKVTYWESNGQITRRVELPA